MALPALFPASKRLYLGIDLGKDTHYVAYLIEKRTSETELQTRVEPIANTAAGFEKLLRKIRVIGADSCYALCEHTGHYGDALLERLQAARINMYRIHIQERTMDKTDERDAQYLAELLYQQAGLHIRPIKPEQRIHMFLPSTPTAQQLLGLVQRHYELVRELTRTKNRLRDLQNRLFPEFTQVIKDPNRLTALAIRKAYPTPDAVANAPIADLLAYRGQARMAGSAFIKLQQLARTSIGVRERQDQMVLEQDQLIDVLKLIETHIDSLEQAIAAIVDDSREGKILLSFGVISNIQAGYIIAGIGSIANFPKASKLCGYFGWAATRKQSGETYNSMKFTRTGNRILKSTMYFIVLHAIQKQTVWAEIYQRLVERKCPYDGRRKKRMGKMKVIVRLGNQIIRLIYLLLKKDYDLLQSLPEGGEVPPPTLYDTAYHREQCTASQLAKND